MIAHNAQIEVWNSCVTSSDEAFQRWLDALEAGRSACTVVGTFTSGAVESLFDSGADTLGDWGDAVVDGVEEIDDTFGSIGEGVGDVFDSIF